MGALSNLVDLDDIAVLQAVGVLPNTSSGSQVVGPQLPPPPVYQGPPIVLNSTADELNNGLRDPVTGEKLYAGFPLAFWLIGGVALALLLRRG